MFLPVNLRIEGRLCVIIGGGDVARRKCRKLLDSGARARLIAPRFERPSAHWPPPQVEVFHRGFLPSDLDGAFLVIAATDDPKLNRAVVSLAQQLSILVQVADNASASDVIFPATLRQGDLTVSFATDGALPALASRLRNEAERHYGLGFASLCAHARELRAKALVKLPPQQREKFFTRLVAPDILDLVRRGDHQAIERALDEQWNQLAFETDPPTAQSGIGKAYLVGAGPGDPGLLTLKAVDCLRASDVVLFDSMVSPLILERFCGHAEQIDVGKRKGRCQKAQEETIALLVQHGLEGRTVTRIKGGDPMIFGRGGEEARALRAAGVPFEIVPGVSCISAVPAYAGIPITDREYSFSFGVYSAHHKGGLALSDSEWQRITQGPDTLIFLMGKTRYASVAQKLIQFGRPATTPAALIFSGTTEHQARIVETLGSLAEKADSFEAPGPGLIVVGEVVRAIPRMDWFDGQKHGFPPFNKEWK